jgi:hypothetical protein
LIVRVTSFVLVSRRATAATPVVASPLVVDRFCIDEVAVFLESGNSIVVATRNARLEPHATRACAIRVMAPDRVALLLPHATSGRALENLEDNGEIAICISAPGSFRTVQLKGRFDGACGATDEDQSAAEEQLRRFGEAVLPFGQSRRQVRNLWLFDGWRVMVEITSAFTQTPGPGAGARMERWRAQ